MYYCSDICCSLQFDGFIDLDLYDSIALKLKGDGRCYISTVSSFFFSFSPLGKECEVKKMSLYIQCYTCFYFFCESKTWSLYIESLQIPSQIYTENWVNSPGQEEDNSWQAFVMTPKDDWYIAKASDLPSHSLKTSSMAYGQLWHTSVSFIRWECKWTCMYISWKARAYS